MKHEVSSRGALEALASMQHMTQHSRKDGHLTSNKAELQK